MQRGLQECRDLDLPERVGRAHPTPTSVLGACRGSRCSDRSAHRQLPRRRSGQTRRKFEPAAVLPRAEVSKSGSNTVPLVARLIFSGLFETLPAAQDRARRSQHRLDPEHAGADRRHVPALSLVHEHRRDAADHAEPHLSSQLLGDLHDRHGRHRAAASPQHRASHVVDRLPAHRYRLAEQPRDHRASLPRRAARRTSSGCCTTTARRCTGSMPYRRLWPRSARPEEHWIPSRRLFWRGELCEPWRWAVVAWRRRAPPSSAPTVHATNSTLVTSVCSRPRIIRFTRASRATATRFPRSDRRRSSRRSAPPGTALVDSVAPQVPR